MTKTQQHEIGTDQGTLFTGAAPAADGQPAQNRLEQIQDRYEQERDLRAKRMADHDAGLAKVQTWEWERMVLPSGTTRRTRQKVTVQYNPNRWRRATGGYSQEICGTLMQFDAYPHPPGKTWREQWDEDHGTHRVPPYGDIEHSVPTVWKVTTRDKARRFTTESGNTWCDRCLPARFRPQSDGSPPPEFGPLAGQEPPRKREPRTEPRDPARYAIPDPLDPGKVSYWYRPERGRDKGKLRPWPPQRNTWGRLYYRNMPDGSARTAANRAFADAHWAKVRQARKAAVAEIEASPELAAARFARYAVACSACGKAMWDERSVTYGIGPECRRGASPGFLSRMLEVTKQVFAEVELEQTGEKP
jgi:hypothetical protein